MVQRNMKVKTRPQRFQDEFTAQFELIFTFELRVFDLVVEGTLFLMLMPWNWLYNAERGIEKCGCPPQISNSP